MYLLWLPFPAQHRTLERHGTKFLPLGDGARAGAGGSPNRRDRLGLLQFFGSLGTRCLFSWRLSWRPNAWQRKFVLENVIDTARDNVLLIDTQADVVIVGRN